MKSRQILTAVGLAFLLCLLACSSGPKQVSVDIPCTAFLMNTRISKEVELGVGDSVKVSLCNLAAAAASGVRWSEEISDERVVRMTDCIWEGDISNPAGLGEEVWTFEALEEGKSYIAMDYTSVWESFYEAFGGTVESPATVIITVVVK